MKLDRNVNDDGTGKYALLKLRKLQECRSRHTFERYTPEVEAAIRTLEKAGVIDWGNAGTEAEFFVVRLKDKYAADALASYGLAAQQDDAEYAAEIMEMAGRAGLNSPWVKLPD